MSRVSKVQFIDYEKSIFKALDLIGARERLPKKGIIIIKPNLTNSSPYPVTTSAEAVHAVLKYCVLYSQAEVLIGEGAGTGETKDAFEALGYSSLAERCRIRLVDFNREKTVTLRRDDTFYLKEFVMPEIVHDAFIISLPVLKDHCFTTTTIAMKNMFGIAPAPVYGGTWNKSRLHTPSTHRSVVDVCRYKKPSLCVVDAAMALSGGHLSGNYLKLGLILAGFDAVAVDAVGSSLLGHSPEKIDYLVQAHRKSIGSMRDIEIVNG